MWRCLECVLRPLQCTLLNIFREREAQEKDALRYLGEFGGPVPDKFGAKLRAAAKADLKASILIALDADKYADYFTVCVVSTVLTVLLYS